VRDARDFRPQRCQEAPGCSDQRRSQPARHRRRHRGHFHPAGRTDPDHAPGNPDHPGRPPLLRG